MSTENARLIERLFGKGYPADHNQLVREEGEASALDPSRRLVAEDLSKQAGFSPGLPLFGTKTDAAYDTRLLARQSVAAARAAAPESVMNAAAAQIAEDEQPQEEVPIDPVSIEYDGDTWKPTVEKFATSSTEAFTTDDVLINGFHIPSQCIDRADQMRVGEILRGLGYVAKQRRVGGERKNVWEPANRSDQS